MPPAIGELRSARSRVNAAMVVVAAAVHGRSQPIVEVVGDLRPPACVEIRYARIGTRHCRDGRDTRDIGSGNFRSRDGAARVIPRIAAENLYLGEQNQSGLTKTTVRRVRPPTGVQIAKESTQRHVVSILQNFQLNSSVELISGQWFLELHSNSRESLHRHSANGSQFTDVCRTRDSRTKVDTIIHTLLTLSAGLVFTDSLPPGSACQPSLNPGSRREEVSVSTFLHLIFDEVSCVRRCLSCTTLRPGRTARGARFRMEIEKVLIVEDEPHARRAWPSLSPAGATAPKPLATVSKAWKRSAPGSPASSSPI